jgi:hypothetical protein
LKVQWETPSTASNTIGPNLNIVNTGSTGIDLANIKVHYYFTADGDTSPMFECDYAGYYNSPMTGFGKSNVSGSFVSMGANATPYTDTFLEISFTSVNLPAGGTVSVNFRIHNANYSVNYNQSNDWSHFSTASPSSYVDANYITAYLTGMLSWGIEPGALPPDAGPSRDGSTGDVDASPADAGDGG